MATKIVYVSATHHGASDEVEIISPRQLDVLLGEGWDVTHQDQVEAPNPTSRKKTITVTRYTLQTKSRGLTVARDRDPERDQRRLARREARAERDVERSLSTRPDNRSYLGGGSAFAGLPGVAVIDSATPEKAFMMGTDAFHGSQLLEDNPFPQGSLPHERWARGWQAAEEAQYGKGNAPDEDPYEMGKKAAKGPKDLEVSCPYPAGTPPYSRWLRGFQDNGGEVQ